jgi:hypothetical protein
MWNDKPDGYLIPAQNPTGTGMNFYPQVWVRVWISTHNLFTDGRLIALPDPNPTRCLFIMIEKECQGALFYRFGTFSWPQIGGHKEKNTDKGRY